MVPSSQLAKDSVACPRTQASRTRASEVRAKTRSTEAWSSSTTTATVKAAVTRRLSCSIGSYPPRAARGPATPFSGRLMERPAGYPISMRSGSRWSTPSLTMTSSKPFLKLALILLPSMPSASFILLLKWP
jgi:hypothetical protein